MALVSTSGCEGWPVASHVTQALSTNSTKELCLDICHLPLPCDGLCNRGDTVWYHSGSFIREREKWQVVRLSYAI